MCNEPARRTERIGSQAVGDVPKVPDVDRHPRLVERVTVTANAPESHLVASLLGDSHDSAVYRAEWVGDSPSGFSTQPSHQNVPRALQLSFSSLVVEPGQPPVRRTM